MLATEKRMVTEKETKLKTKTETMLVTEKESRLETESEKKSTDLVHDRSVGIQC